MLASVHFLFKEIVINYIIKKILFFQVLMSFIIMIPRATEKYEPHFFVTVHCREVDSSIDIMYMFS